MCFIYALLAPFECVIIYLNLHKCHNVVMLTYETLLLIYHISEMIPWEKVIVGDSGKMRYVRNLKRF